MKKNKNSTITHGFFNNLKFMINEQWVFEKKALAIPFVRVFSELGAALMGLCLPKLVLDAIEQTVPPNEFLIRICGLTFALMILRYISFYTEQSVIKSAVKILNMRFYISKDWKALDMDYAISTSQEGKIKIEKGHSSINRNVYVNMASFYINLVELFKSILGLLSYCAIILILNPVIIVLLMLSYIIDGLMTVRVQKWEHSIKTERAVINKKLGYVLDEINNSFIVKDIRIYHMMDWINSNTNEVINEKARLEEKVETKHFNQRLVEIFLIFIRNGGGYIYLIWKMLHSDMSIGDFTLYFGAITGFGQWLEQIVSRVSSLSNANYRVDDYRYLLETKDGRRRDKGAKLPSMNAPVEITLENISYSYEGSDQMILKNINLKISKGEKLAVVGSNGAGKTTLIKLIGGLLEPSSGRILLNGIDIHDFNRDEYYKLISASFQNVCLLPMSIAENIAYAPDKKINYDKLNECIRLADLDEKIASLPKGVETELVPSVVDRGINLSGGEMQKLLLARAIYKEAPVIILDEPTAALDPLAESRMYQHYNELTKNRTAIYISHRLSSTRFCDRIIFIDDGMIIEEGTHDELMDKRGRYKEVFDIQSQYYNDSDEEKVV